MKPGVHTTEFWLTLAVQVGNLIAALQNDLSPHWAAVVAAASAGLYALARGWAKSGAGGPPA